MNESLPTPEEFQAKHLPDRRAEDTRRFLKDAEGCLRRGELVVFGLPQDVAVHKKVRDELAKFGWDFQETLEAEKVRLTPLHTGGFR